MIWRCKNRGKTYQREIEWDKTRYEQRNPCYDWIFWLWNSNRIVNNCVVLGNYNNQYIPNAIVMKLSRL